MANARVTRYSVPLGTHSSGGNEAFSNGSSIGSTQVAYGDTNGKIKGVSTFLFNGTALSVGGTALATYADSTVTPVIQAIGTGATVIGATRFSSTSANAPTLSLGHSLGTTVGDYTAVAAGNVLGSVICYGSDGTDLSQAGSIGFSVDTGATISAGVVPGRFRVITNDASGTATQASAVDSAQVTIIGNSTAASDGVYASGTVRPWLQVIENTSAVHGMALTRFRAAATASTLYFGKTRSSTYGTMTVCTTGDTLGTISFEGADGTNFVSAAKIIATCTGTLGSTQVPGNLVFQTGTNASPSVLTTALTIDNAQGITTAAARIVKVRSVASAAGTTVLDSSDHAAICTGSTTQTFTLPACATGRVLYIKNRSSGNLTVNRAGSDTIDGGTTTTLTANQAVTLIGNSTDWTIN